MDRIHRMSRGRKTLLSLLLVGALGAVAGIGTFSAFSATTVNAGNTFDAGTVVDLRQRREHRDVQHHGREAERRRRSLHPRDLHGIARRRRCASTRPPPVNAIGQYVTSRSTRAPMPGATRSRTAPASRLRRTSSAERSSSFAAAQHELRDGRTSPHPACRPQWNQNDSARLPVHADAAGQPAAQPAWTSGRAQLHVGGAERLTPSDPGGPRSGPPGPPREAPVQLLPGPGSPDRRRSNTAPSDAREG